MSSENVCASGRSVKSNGRHVVDTSSRNNDESPSNKEAFIQDANSTSQYGGGLLMGAARIDAKYIDGSWCFDSGSGSG
jgi:hypothetical protein